MKNVFLSYSRENRELAGKFARMIRALPDVHLFQDDRDIAVGDIWTDSISKALDEMHVFVALVSDHWTDSTYCQKEYRAAEDRAVTIVPVWLVPCPYDRLAIARHQGFKAPGNKAISQFRGPEQMAQIKRAVDCIAEAIGRVVPGRPLVDPLCEYAVPDFKAERPPLIVFHCGLRSGEHPPGKQLKEALEELLGPCAETSLPQLHDVTKETEPPKFMLGQTVFVVDSPTTNPVARDVLLNYQRYMVGTKIHHTTTLDRGIQVQSIWADGQALCSDRHQVALDERGSADGFDDYLVIMRLPGLVLSGDFGDDAAQTTVWLVYGTTYRGSFAGASLFFRDSFKKLVDLLSKGKEAPPAAFQAIFRVPSTPERVTRFTELGVPKHIQVLQSLRDHVRGDPVPARLGSVLLEARSDGNHASIPIAAVHMDLVAYCNYNCQGCIEAELREKRLRLSYKRVVTILQDVKKQQCRDLSFYGGEPTLHPNFNDIVELALSLGLSTTVVTNGSTLTDPRIFNGLMKLGDKVRVRVSIDANSQSTYTSHHGHKSSAFRFDQVRDAAKDLARSVPVGISYLVTENNVDELADAIKFWKDSSVRSFNPRVPMGRNGRWRVPAGHAQIRAALQSIPWEQYPPDWLITPDWLLDWIHHGSEPNPVWAFSNCYSAYYRIVISPYNESLLPPGERSDDPVDTEGAWLSLCPYHRYDPAYGCPYPDDLAAWCKDQRPALVDRISPNCCERIDRIVCSRVAHNTSVQAEINRLRFPVSATRTPASA